MCNLTFDSFIRVIMMMVMSAVLVAIFAAFGFVKSAKAGEFDIMVSGDYQYWITDNVMFYGEG